MHLSCAADNNCSVQRNMQFRGFQYMFNLVEYLNEKDPHRSGSNGFYERICAIIRNPVRRC